MNAKAAKKMRRVVRKEQQKWLRDHGATRKLAWWFKPAFVLMLVAKKFGVKWSDTAIMWLAKRGQVIQIRAEVG